jgi:hypothetical protein
LPDIAFPLPDRAPDTTLTGAFAEEHERTLEHIPFDVPDGVDQLLIDPSTTIASDRRRWSAAGTPSTSACSTSEASPAAVPGSAAGAAASRRGW